MRLCGYFGPSSLKGIWRRWLPGNTVRLPQFSSGTSVSRYIAFNASGGLDSAKRVKRSDSPPSVCV